MRAQCYHQTFRKATRRHVEEEIILADFYCHFQEKKMWIVLTNALCISDQSNVWYLSVFWQNVLVKFPDPMLLVNLEYFIIKKRNAEFYQYSVLQKSNFNWRWQLLKKLYKICTNEYGNHEYLATDYIRYFTDSIIWCL